MGLQITGGKLCPQVLLMTLLRMRKSHSCCTISPLGGSVAHVLRWGKNLHLPWYDPRGIVIIQNIKGFFLMGTRAIVTY